MEDMSTDADTGSHDETQVSPAGTAEHSIPKHRFDEVTRQNRELKEHMQHMRGLIERMAPQPQQQAQPTINFEQLGVDPQTGQAILEIAKQVAKDELKGETAQLRRMVGITQNSIEEVHFLNEYGQDKKSVLPALKAKQQEYAQKGFGFLPLGDAFSIVMFQQAQRKPRTAAAAHAPNGAGVASQPTPQADLTGNEGHLTQGGYPNPDLTRVQPGASGAIPTPSAAKRFSERTLEEQEALLDEQFAGGSI